MLPLEMVHDGEGFVLMPIEEQHVEKFLSFEDRMALLDNELDKRQPEELGAELAAGTFLEDKVSDDLPEVCYKIATWWNDRKLQRRIVCAANRFVMTNGEYLVIPGSRHYSPDMANVTDAVRENLVSDHVTGEDQGFIDQWGDYWNRKDAFIIAYHAGQINKVRKKGAPFDTLFSEDLY